MPFHPPRRCEERAVSSRHVQGMLDMMSGASGFKYPPVAKLLRTDQALHNVLVYVNKSLFDAGHRVLALNNESWVYHMHYEVLNVGQFRDSLYAGYATSATHGFVINRWGLFPAIVHQYDRDPKITEMIDRTLAKWAETAKVPGMVWLGPEHLSSEERSCGWQRLGADEDYAWMEHGDQRSFHRVPRRSVVVSLLPR